jgi:hypothetical protein
MSHSITRVQLIKPFSPVWTIRDDRRNRTFGVHQKLNDKTAVVAFVQRSDAHFVARSLEEFYGAHGRFPYSHAEVEGEEPDTLRALRSPRIIRPSTSMLYLRAYDTMSDVTDMCKSNFLDLCVCLRLKRRTTTFDFIGTFVSIDADVDKMRATAQAALDAVSDDADADTDAYLG